MSLDGSSKPLNASDDIPCWAPLARQPWSTVPRPTDCRARVGTGRPARQREGGRGHGGGAGHGARRTPRGNGRGLERRGGARPPEGSAAVHCLPPRASGVCRVQPTCLPASRRDHAGVVRPNHPSPLSFYEAREFQRQQAEFSSCSPADEKRFWNLTFLPSTARPEGGGPVLNPSKPACLNPKA